MKKFLALVLVIVLCCASMVACSSNGKVDSASQSNETIEKTADVTVAVTPEPAEPAKLFDEPFEITVMKTSYASWPFQEDWYINKATEEKTNVQLKIEAIGGTITDYTNKINLSLATGQMPDLISGKLDFIDLYGSQGALLNIKDYMDQLPNFKKWCEENPLELLPYYSADGSLYMFPISGIGETNRLGYIYRKDIFDKHNLSIPKDDVELYNVLIELKKLYPDTYPLTLRSSFGRFRVLAESWGSGWEYYYDSSKNEWRYGAIEDNYKTMVAYFQKLYKEGLIPADWLTQTTSAWQDAIGTEKSFITCDYLSRIDSFNIMIRGTNPDCQMSYLPPIKGGNNGVAKMGASAETFEGYVISSQTKIRDKVLKFMDWYYTDEAKELVSWGEEGKTYQVVDGKRQYIDAPDIATVCNKYGLGSSGTYQLYDFEAELCTYTDELRSAVVEDRKYDMPIQPKMSFTAEEQDILKTVGVNLYDHMTEQISKFLLDQRPMSEWDKYVKEMKDLGVDQIVEVYRTAYDRLTK